MPVSRKWIEDLNQPPNSRAAMDLTGRFSAIAGPRWDGIKSELKSSVDFYNVRPETRHRVDLVDTGRKVRLTSLDHSLDIIFFEDQRRIVAYYERRFKGRQQKKVSVGLRLEIREDYLIILDRRGCPVNEPAELLLKPFFRSLARAERETFWDRSTGSFPR